MMNRTLSFVSSVIVSAGMCLATNAVDARTSLTTTHSVGSAPCLQDTELRESIAGLKQQFGPDLWKVSESLLRKAKVGSGCRKQIVEALITTMAQTTDPKGNQYENFFFWLSGASMLADLKATEALDLLIANIDFTDGWSIQLTENHTPALAAILRFGVLAIPKLQIVLMGDTVLSRRQFAAYAIAYIGGAQAKTALKSALPRETDPCLKKFLEVSLKAFNNKEKTNHISSALKGKWLGAFYCP